MNDYICNYFAAQASLIVSAITASHATFVASVSNFQEPQTYHQAATQPHSIHAMKAEIKALENNQTWDITPLPHGKRAIDCRWICKLKFRPDGTIDRHKARLLPKVTTK